MIVVPLHGRWLDNLEFLGRIGCIAGLVTLIPGLPSAVKVLTLGAFMLLAPGCAVLVWVTGMPRYLLRVLVPLLGLAVTILVSYLAVLENLWHPAIQLLAMAVACAASLLIHRQQGRTSVSNASNGGAVPARGPNS